MWPIELHLLFEQADEVRHLKCLHASILYDASSFKILAEPPGFLRFYLQLIRQPAIA